MAVLVEAISVIVRIDALKARFAGGVPAFERTVPNRAVCNDEHLVRVGFMDTSDANAYVTVLEAGGLLLDRRGNATVDVAVVIQKKGPTVSSPWLRYEDQEIDGKKLSLCWLAGAESKGVGVPKGWVYERSLSKDGPGFMPSSVIGDRMKFLRRENGVEVYLDMQTNKEVYAGRPQIKGDTPGVLKTQIDAAMHAALAIEAKGPVPPPPRFWQKADPRYAKLNGELLPAMERIVRGSGRDIGAAHFALGAILRLLNRRAEAMKSFLRVRELLPGVPGVLRDLVRCLAELGKPQEALPYAREAAKLAPMDVAVLGNLAGCLMQCGQKEEALVVVERALEFEPGDAINQGIRKRLKAGRGK